MAGVSFWTEIRDATAARLVAAGVTGGRVFKSRALPADGADVPYTLVFVHAENAEPDGDANAGPPSFKEVKTIAIAVTAAGNDGPTIEEELDAAIETIKLALFEGAAWLALIEAVLRYGVDYQKLDGELLSVRAVLAIDVVTRVDYEIQVTDDLAKVALRDVTGDEGGIDLDLSDGVIDVEAEYDIPTT